LAGKEEKGEASYTQLRKKKKTHPPARNTYVIRRCVCLGEKERKRNPPGPAATREQDVEEGGEIPENLG